MKKRNKFRFGKLSNKRRKDVSKYLIMCSDRALSYSPVDFGVPQYGGKRSAEEQNGLYLKDYSKCDGYSKLSFHQKEDKEGRGQAIDLVPYISGKGYSYKAKGRFGVIGILMLQSWDELKAEGKIPEGLFLHWGGFWRSRTKEGLGWDLPHYEIRDFEQKEKV